MCGIFGGIQKEGEVASIIHAALKLLEYRGYDSVGLATVDKSQVHVKKDAGTIDQVHAVLNLDDLPGGLGIGHTRWATHGAPYKVNAHPHVDCNGEIAVIHNGIIENFADLKAELELAGHVFKSKTDTEVVSHLIEEKMKQGMSLTEAFREAANRLEGSYALAAISSKEPDKIVCARKESPLVLGVGDKGVYLASDIPAFLPLTNKAVIIENGELVVLTATGYEISKTKDGTPIAREPEIVDWDPEMAEKQGYPHFMFKEIY